MEPFRDGGEDADRFAVDYFPYRWQKQKYRSEAGRYRIGRMTNQGPGERTENLYNNPEIGMLNLTALGLSF